jgi:hypothetical protein
VYGTVVWWYDGMMSDYILPNFIQIVNNCFQVSVTLAVGEFFCPTLGDKMIGKRSGAPHFLCHLLANLSILSHHF